MTKTYDAATFRRAKRAWSEGRFGSEWDEARRTSWERGFPLPPRGSYLDNPEEDEDQTQRSIVRRALDYRPEGTLDIIARSHSWGDVVAAVMGAEQRLHREADEAERQHDDERRRWPTRSEATRIQAALEQRTGIKL
jgi:hypothetical protein